MASRDFCSAPPHSGKSSQFIEMTSFEHQFALYVRDRWRPTSRLTLDLGLRWELYPNRTREDGLGIESPRSRDQRRADRRAGRFPETTAWASARSSLLPAWGSPIS